MVEKDSRVRFLVGLDLEMCKKPIPWRLSFPDMVLTNLQGQESYTSSFLGHFGPLFGRIFNSHCTRLSKESLHISIRKDALSRLNTHSMLYVQIYKKSKGAQPEQERLRRDKTGLLDETRRQTVTKLQNHNSTRLFQNPAGKKSTKCATKTANMPGVEKHATHLPALLRKAVFKRCRKTSFRRALWRFFASWVAELD